MHYKGVMETPAQIAADLAALPAHHRAAAREYYAKQAAFAAADIARQNADAAADALDSVNPAFAACTGDYGTPTMDSSAFRPTAAGETFAGLGWGDEERARILRARG